jgi:hypothetical protein
MQLFQSYFNNFGTLTWEFEPPSQHATFLDLNISIENHSIAISLHEKALNLHLYIPSHSCHPPGILRSLIFGRVLHAFRITRDADKCAAFARQLSSRLHARGYDINWLRPIFNEAYRNATEISGASLRKKEKKETLRALFAHVHFHPADPPSSTIQRTFREHCAWPPQKTPLNQMTNKHNKPLDIDRLIVAYHRPRNLGNLLAPRKLQGQGPSVSATLTALRRDAQGP